MPTATLVRSLISILAMLGMALSPAAAFAQGAPVTIGGPFEGEASALTGAGATFPAPLYQKWFSEYASLTGVNINYQAIGSGGGIKGIQDQTVDFGASDAPMTDEQLAAARGGQLFHIPTALGAIVPTYNVPEATTQINFTGDTLAGIYLGDIQTWNDPRLVADNPFLSGVDQPIVVVHRSDGSGTTFGFTDYLSKVSADWQSKVGKSTSVNWPVGLGASGNAGVAGEVQGDAYSIGYVELIYAVQNNLGYGTVLNSAGTFINPSLASVTAAADSAANLLPADLRFSIANAPGADAYPISTATWLLAYRDTTDTAKALALTRMLWWVTHDGQRFNNDLAYATVPPALTARSEEFIRQITVNGKPIFPNR
jgi:phosphate transport system substrate-binding protein